LNEHTDRKAKNRQKAIESKARKVERITWHAENSRHPAEENRRLFDLRIKEIVANYQEQIEAIEEDEPYQAELIKMGMCSVLSAERRARAQARNQERNRHLYQLPAVFLDFDQEED
jgi:hypothetical protein